MPHPLVLLQAVLPQHALSRVMHRLMRARHLPLRNTLLRWAIRHYRIDLEEALHPDYTDRSIYPDLNSCFTRALKPAARPIAPGDDVVVSPADGTLSQFGTLHDDRLLEAKGHDYSLRALLADDTAAVNAFHEGEYATIYLSPRDYHRVHMPLAGQLRRMIHVPGRLFSVSPWNMRHVPGLFARNERVISLFDTPAGQLAVILVGAIFVGSIETVWAGEITPPAGRRIETWDYGEDGPRLAKGEEMGRFNMGSTVILLFQHDRVRWAQGLATDQAVRMGQALGRISGAGVSASA